MILGSLVIIVVNNDETLNADHHLIIRFKYIFLRDGYAQSILQHVLKLVNKYKIVLLANYFTGSEY